MPPLPDIYLNGKTYHRSGGNSAGMIFYNDEGTENGGLAADSGAPRRVMVGKSEDEAAVVVLADPAGRPRLRLAVDSLGAAHIEVLDENGVATSVLPK